MTKKAKQGITDRQFNTLVDDGFKAPSRKVNRGGAKPWVPPDDVIKKLEEEGHVEGLSKRAARFNALCSRMLGVPPSKSMSPEQVKQLNEMDAQFTAIAHANGIELIDD